MNPRQKYKLLVLAFLFPYLLLLILELTTRTHFEKWVGPACLCYSFGALILIFRYLRTHPELRPTAEEQRKRLDAIDPRKARMAMIGVIAVSALTCSLYLFFARRPPAYLVCRQGVERAQDFFVFTRRVAWGFLGAYLLVSLRLCQVAFRKHKNERQT